jgi:hypothetical protein
MIAQEASASYKSGAKTMLIFATLQLRMTGTYFQELQKQDVFVEVCRDVFTTILK